MLSIEHLSVSYRPPTLAVADLSLHVNDGEIAVLLGANGAGKTTTLNCLFDFVRPVAGRACVDGIVVAERPLAAKRRLAFVPENVHLYGALTGRENLCFFAGLDGERLTAADSGTLLERVGLQIAAVDRPVRTYSKGMRQKVGIAVALARHATNVVLDEPTSGLDPIAAADLVTAMEALRSDGCALLVTTHDLPRAHRTADRIYAMARGALVAEWVGRDLAGADLERVYLDAMAVA